MISDDEISPTNFSVSPTPFYRIIKAASDYTLKSKKRQHLGCVYLGINLIERTLGAARGKFLSIRKDKTVFKISESCEKLFEKAENSVKYRFYHSDKSVNNRLRLFYICVICVSSADIT